MNTLYQDKTVQGETSVLLQYDKIKLYICTLQANASI